MAGDKPISSGGMFVQTWVDRTVAVLTGAPAVPASHCWGPGVVNLRPHVTVFQSKCTSSRRGRDLKRLLLWFYYHREYDTAS